MPLNANFPPTISGPPTDQKLLKEKAADETKKVNRQATVITSSVPSIISGVMPPSLRPVSLFASAGTFMPAVQQAILRHYDNTPDSPLHQAIGNLLRYGMNVPGFMTMAAGLHPSMPTGKAAALLQTSWERACENNPLMKKLLGHVPVVAIAARVAAQLAANEAGTSLQNTYYQKVGDVKESKSKNSEQEAGLDPVKFVNVLMHDRELHLLVLLPALAYSAPGRKLIQDMLLKKNSGASDLALSVKTEGVAAAILSAVQTTLAQKGRKGESSKKIEEIKEN